MNLTKLMVLSSLCFITATASGCAFGDRKVTYKYEPVIKLKASRPQSVAVVTLTSERKPGNQAQIAQIRNGFGMVTAKVLCAEDDPMIWIADALASELTNAGYSVTRVSSTDATTAPLVVGGSVQQFFADMGLEVVLHAKVRLTVTRNGASAMDKRYQVDEGLGSLTVNSAFYTQLTTGVLTRLMRRSVPDIIESIESNAAASASASD